MENLKEIDKSYVLHTYDRKYINFISGDSATLKTDDDREFIDFSSGIGVVSVGHGNAKLSDAICNQAKNMIHISNLFAIEPQAKAAQKIVELSGYDARCFFANSGAEANEGAIKIARKYGEVDGEVKRYKIITVEHSFHGRTITALKATGQESMHNYFGPYPDGFVYVKNLEEIYEVADNHTVAVLIELVQGEGGVEPMEVQKVLELQKFLKSKDILLMIDEVQTGVYRVGEFLASNSYGIKPDVITLAKGLAGGVPIGVILTRLKEIFSYGDHGSTFGGNYLSSRAALEVLNILEEYKKSGELDKNLALFQKELNSVFSEYKNLFESVVGIGFMRGLRAKNSDIQKKIINSCFENGLLVLKAGRNTVRFLPPLTIKEDEIKLGFEKFRKSLKEI